VPLAVVKPRLYLDRGVSILITPSRHLPLLLVHISSVYGLTMHTYLHLLARDPGETGSVEKDPQLQSTAIVKTDFEAVSSHMVHNAGVRCSWPRQEANWRVLSVIFGIFFGIEMSCIISVRLVRHAEWDMVPGPTLKIGPSLARANGQHAEHCSNRLAFRNLKIVSECLGTSLSLLVLDEAKFSSYLCACIRHLKCVYAHARIQTRAHKHIHRP